MSPPKPWFECIYPVLVAFTMTPDGQILAWESADSGNTWISLEVKKW